MIKLLEPSILHLCKMMGVMVKHGQDGW